MIGEQARHAGCSTAWREHSHPEGGGSHHNERDDEDEDGIEDMWDGKGRRESQCRYDDEHDTAARAHSTRDVTTASGTVLLVGLVTANDPIAPVTVEIVNAFGQVVASSPTLPGGSVVTYVPVAGGTYSVRAKNNGFTPVRFSTTIITREAWLF